MNTFPKRFKEHSHAHYAEGWCHGLGVMADGRPYALLEYDCGTVRMRYLDGAYWIQFTGDPNR